VRDVRPLDPARVLSDVGRRVAELRLAAGLTQEELAEALAVSVKYVQRVERGRDNLTLDSMVKLVNALGARMADLHVPPRAVRTPTRAAPAKRRRRARA
jgi:HTH-type transcriptional regulator / antitoxin HipB